MAFETPFTTWTPNDEPVTFDVPYEVTAAHRGNLEAAELQPARLANCENLSPEQVAEVERWFAAELDNPKSHMHDTVMAAVSEHYRDWWEGERADRAYDARMEREVMT